VEEWIPEHEHPDGTTGYIISHNNATGCRCCAARLTIDVLDSPTLNPAASPRHLFIKRKAAQTPPSLHQFHSTRGMGTMSDRGIWLNSLNSAASSASFAPPFVCVMRASRKGQHERSWIVILGSWGAIQKSGGLQLTPR